jgi:hypothetical protein
MNNTASFRAVVVAAVVAAVVAEVLNSVTTRKLGALFRTVNYVG